MELLNIRLIKLDAVRRLKKNLARAISLVFVMILIFVALSISRKLIDIFIRSFGVDTMLTPTLSLSMLISTIISFVLSVTILMPLWLNIKKWFMNLKTEGPPLKATLSIVASPRAYIKTIVYASIKALIISVILVLLSTPSILLYSILKTQTARDTNVDQALQISLVVLTIIFVLIALLYGIYIFMGFFYADYVYLSKVEQNPFKAMLVSLKISKSSRMKLITLCISVLPYLVLSLFIVPIIFTIPLIQSTLACFAKQQLGIYLYEQSQN